MKGGLRREKGGLPLPHPPTPRPQLEPRPQGQEICSVPNLLCNPDRSPPCHMESLGNSIVVWGSWPLPLWTPIPSILIRLPVQTAGPGVLAPDGPPCWTGRLGQDTPTRACLPQTLAQARMALGSPARLGDALQFIEPLCSPAPQRRPSRLQGGLRESKRFVQGRPANEQPAWGSTQASCSLTHVCGTDCHTVALIYA